MFQFFTPKNVYSGSKSNKGIYNFICSPRSYDVFPKWPAKSFGLATPDKNIRVFQICCLSLILFVCFCFSLYPMPRSMNNVLESVWRQVQLQKVLRQRLWNPWSPTKSHIVVFNHTEFQHLRVMPKITWSLVQRLKSAIFSFSACGTADGWIEFPKSYKIAKF